MAGSGGTVTWSTTSVTLAVGETITVNYTTTSSDVQSANFAPLIASVATFTEGTNKIDLTGTAAGTVTVAANTTVAYETHTTNALTITVVAEDQNFLNERGLAHFWGNIDSAKQNKLTAGSHITINNDTISATQPTVNNATLTIKQNNVTVGTFSANSSTATTATINAPNCYNLYGQVQASAYRRSVIALCKVSTTNSTSLHSWFTGRIAFHRDNGLAGIEEIHINMENQYYGAYYTNVSFISNFPLLSASANKDSAIGWRPCTFKYGDVYYGGIELCTGFANYNIVAADGMGNFDIFGVDYYSMAHDSTASSVLNSEIYNSINYTQWSETYNQWRVGRATRDIIYNNGSGTNANFSTTTAMSNYDEVEISYRDGNQNYAFKRIPGAAGSFVLDIAHPGANNTVYWYISRYIVSGTNVTVGANNTRKAIGASSITTTASQDIYITRVTGIRY